MRDDDPYDLRTLDIEAEGARMAAAQFQREDMAIDEMVRAFGQMSQSASDLSRVLSDTLVDIIASLAEWLRSGLPTAPPVGRVVRSQVGFIAWRDGRWRPIHRVAGLGWVWSDL